MTFDILSFFYHPPFDLGYVTPVSYCDVVIICVATSLVILVQLVLRLRNRVSSGQPSAKPGRPSHKIDSDVPDPDPSVVASDPTFNINDHDIKQPSNASLSSVGYSQANITTCNDQPKNEDAPSEQGSAPISAQRVLLKQIIAMHRQKSTRH